MGCYFQSPHYERVLSGIMWKIGILGYSFQSPHYEGVLSGIMWKIGILGCYFQSPHYEGVLSGIMWKIGILGYSISIPSPGEGAQWHYVENGHFGLPFSIHTTRRGCSVALCGEWAFWVTLFPSPHQERVLSGIMWRMGILGYPFQSTPPGEGAQWHYSENGHFRLLYSIPPP